MTKKDYVKAAQIVAELNRQSFIGPIDRQAAFCKRAEGAEDAFVTLFKSDNPNFDETRFREACKKGTK